MACPVLFQRRRIFTNSRNRPISFFSDAGSCQTTAASRSPSGRGGVATTNHRLLHVEQLFVVRHITMTFDGKRKIFRRLIAPLLECAFLRQLVECAVDLDAGETFRAKPEPLFLRRVSIETVTPAFVVPAAGADACFARHSCYPWLSF